MSEDSYECGAIDALTDAKNYALNEPTVGLWISTDDRLPVNGQTVLVYSKFGHISDAVFDVHVSGIMTFDPYGYVAGEDVKYWMPMMETPEAW